MFERFGLCQVPGFLRINLSAVIVVVCQSGMDLGMSQIVVSHDIIYRPALVQVPNNYICHSNSPPNDTRLSAPCPRCAGNMVVVNRNDFASCFTL